MLSEKSLTKKVHTVWFCIYQVLQHAKLTYDGKKNQTSGCFWMGGERLNDKGIRELSVNGNFSIFIGLGLITQLVTTQGMFH